MLDAESSEDRITLIPSGDDMVPTSQGETVSLFLTDAERNFMAKALTMQLLLVKSQVEKGLCRSLLLKLPKRR